MIILTFCVSFVFGFIMCSVISIHNFKRHEKVESREEGRKSDA